MFPFILPFELLTLGRVEYGKPLKLYTWSYKNENVSLSLKYWNIFYYLVVFDKYFQIVRAKLCQTVCFVFRFHPYLYKFSIVDGYKKTECEDRICGRISLPPEATLKKVCFLWTGRVAIFAPTVNFFFQFFLFLSFFFLQKFQ